MGVGILQIPLQPTHMLQMQVVYDAIMIITIMQVELVVCIIIVG